PPFLLLPEVRERRLEQRRAGAAGSRDHLQPPEENASEEGSMSTTLDRLAAVIESRKPENGGDPDKSYVARLFAKGDDAILKKIGEEASETVMAAKDVRAGADASKLLYEVADLWFHSAV